MASYTSIIRQFSKARICVIGDMTADVFIYGKPYRLSREAPVIVVRYASEELVPGGAANTVNNLLDLGAQVYPVGLLGRDYFGEKLFSIIAGKCPNMDGMILEPGCHTIMKTRILAGDDNTTKQQVIRIDRDFETPLAGENERQILTYLKGILPSIDAVVVSDYGYGIFAKKVLAFIKQFARDKIVVVDSRYHMQYFKGATIITPNQSEAEQITGLEIQDDATLHQAGGKLLQLIKCRAALITQGNKGMTLFEHNKKPLHIPVVGSDKISDVTGAGDTVVSLATLALVAGANFPTAARLANYAASVVVMKPGTATLSVGELKAAIAANGK
jgi:D-glycero-beta-D-manno-heptose-7-phosphate kinase